MYIIRDKKEVIVMKKKNELLQKMAEEIHAINGVSFEEIVLVYPNVNDLCEETFPNDPGEASRATYFGNISDWSAQCRLDSYGNIVNVTETALEKGIEAEEEEIIEKYLEEYGKDKLYQEYLLAKDS